MRNYPFHYQMTVAVLCLLFFRPYLAYAEQVDAEHYWVCTAHDAQSKTWTSTTSYELTATNLAFEACKKESAEPMSCQIKQNDCEEFLHGMSTRAQWRCVAFDQKGHTWPSQLYAQRDDAAIAAKSICQENSDIPGSCYINLSTCRNIHEVRP